MIDFSVIKQRQSLPLQAKIVLSETRIRAWYEYWKGDVYVAFSGGKDSTVLLDIVRRLYPNTEAVFVDTGLEYPEIRDFVKSVPNVTWLKPKISFKQVIEKYGYPVISKQVSRYVNDLQRDGDNEATKNLRLTGCNRKGVYCPSQKLSKKWLKLVDAPFKCSNVCCDIMKKAPFKRYEKQNHKVPFIGTMAEESHLRLQQYSKYGCNAFDSKIHPSSTPMAFWTEKDVWEYIRMNNLTYASIYDKGEKRTGCCFCMFGINKDGVPNRFQRMADIHPELYNYCMNKLGIKDVLTYLDIPYLPTGMIK